MNHASFLPLLAATAFALPLLTRLGQAVGVPRPASMALTLLVAAGVGAWLVLRRRPTAPRSSPERPPQARRPEPEGGSLPKAANASPSLRLTPFDGAPLGLLATPAPSFLAPGPLDPVPEETAPSEAEVPALEEETNARI